MRLLFILNGGDAWDAADWKVLIDRLFSYDSCIFVKFNTMISGIGDGNVAIRRHGESLRSVQRFYGCTHVRLE